MARSREQLPLSRDSNGQVHLDATGPVNMYVHQQELLGSGGQGTVFRAKIFDTSGTRLLMDVRINKQIRVGSHNVAPMSPLGRMYHNRSWQPHKAHGRD